MAASGRAPPTTPPGSWPTGRSTRSATQGVGDLLLALATGALDRGVDPEAALRGALRGYAGAVRAAEAAGS